MEQPRRIAYFSMEIGFHARIPTYSGGLGVLAGDTVVSSADLRVPMVAVTLVHRKGYFVQELDAEGIQHEKPADWNPAEFLELMPQIICLQIEGRNVFVRAWRYLIHGVAGGNVPVFLLDTNLDENHPQDRDLTDHLYGGEQRYRLCQEVILGIGGMRMLRALGYRHLERFHMNEGHAALLTLELLRESMAERDDKNPTAEDIASVRRQCVFTTHTPVPAGHDQFPINLVEQVLGKQDILRHTNSLRDGHLNMTYLALNLSRFANSVSRRHGEVSRQMFPGYAIDSITNGVHAATWTSDPIAALLDKHVPLWRQDNLGLRHAMNLSKPEVWDAHMHAKRALIDHVNNQTNAGMDAEVFTLGFARRAASYKRADLLVSDPARLKAMADRFGPMQIVYAGKAHPRDGGGKELIRRVHEAIQTIAPQIRMVYLPNYEMPLGRLITAGVDVWVNTPLRPFEASGTSGMKAALNGVPSLSVLDGWWVEGCIEGVTGWAVGGDTAWPADDNGSQDAASLYKKLEHAVLPTFHQQRDCFIHMMRQSIAINGSYFNTQRMMQDYVVKAYYS
ncbi:MAG: alpha-glucan family phosphorylase [Phycisphaerales bacterium]|nr:alpha-glucan family phosphorylase [Phycisphaerales bacterium]MCI0631468.1 alpha-glucan family phosphorylase [Phycisphaerales bacterium]MCI0675459.1 alpha-glucan family phosphorylase [Phycisphaerales bacterium]